MKTSLLYLILSFFVVSIIGLFIWFLQDAYNIATPVIDKSKAIQNEQDREMKSSDDWLIKLSQKEQNSYYYPVIEVDIKFDLSEYKNSVKEYNKTYKIIIPNLDEYKFFCVKQVLSFRKIDYSYYKSGDKLNFVISTSDDNYMNKVLKELKIYGIDYKVEQQKEQNS